MGVYGRPHPHRGYHGPHSRVSHTGTTDLSHPRQSSGGGAGGSEGVHDGNHDNHHVHHGNTSHNVRHTNQHKTAHPAKHHTAPKHGAMHHPKGVKK